MSELSDFLLYVPIFSELPKETVEKISQVGNRRSYKRDSIILMEEEDGSAMFVIVSGKVKISRTSNDGREVILSILSASDFFGEMALLDGLSRSATVVAIEDSEVFIIQRTQFIELLYQHPEISVSLLTELTTRLRQADMKIKALSLKDAEGKVATVLLEIAMDMGKIKHGVVEIEKLPLQQDLANMAGTSRETISRTLHSFAKKKLIELDGSRLRIMNYENFKGMFV